MNKHYQLYRIYSNVLKLSELRGYQVEHLTFEAFSERFVLYDTIIRSSMNLIIQQHMSILFHDNQTLTMAQLKDIHNYLTQYDIRHCILVTKSAPSSNILRELHRLSGVHIEVFSDKELLYNPLEHQDVPKYRVLSSDEVEQVKKHYNMSSDNFPILNKSDIVAKWLNLKRNMVLEVTSPSETSGLYTSYRMVA